MKTIITVDNLKCGGCAGSIKKGLKSFPEVKEVTVDIDQEQVEVICEDFFPLEKIKTKLEAMGYPERGSKTGLDKFMAGARSYVSCAIGKLNPEEENDKLSKHH